MTRWVKTLVSAYKYKSTEPSIPAGCVGRIINVVDEFLFVVSFPFGDEEERATYFPEELEQWYGFQEKQNR